MRINKWEYDESLKVWVLEFRAKEKFYECYIAQTSDNSFPWQANEFDNEHQQKTNIYEVGVASSLIEAKQNAANWVIGKVA